MGDTDSRRTDAPRRAAWRWGVLFVGLLAVILVPFALFDESLGTLSAQALDAAQRRPAAVAGLIVLLLALDSVLPIPASVVSVFAGAALGWGGGAAAIWIGATLGGLLGYALGWSAGRGAAMRLVGAEELARAHRLADRIGPTTLILTRAVPVVSEAAALMAGIARMPLLPFLVVTGIGNLAVAITYAGIGSAAMSSESSLLAFAGLVLLPALGWGLWYVWRRRRRGAGRATAP